MACRGFEAGVQLRFWIVYLFSEGSQCVILSVDLVLVCNSTFANQLYFDLREALNLALLRLTKEDPLVLLVP